MEKISVQFTYSPSPFQKPPTTDLVLNKACGGELSDFFSKTTLFGRC